MPSCASLNGSEEEKVQQQQGRKKEEKKSAKAEIRGSSQFDAIEIKAPSEDSYSDILRKVKAAAELKPLREGVTRVRRAKAREVLFELGRPGAETSSLQTVVPSTLNS